MFTEEEFIHLVNLHMDTVFRLAFNYTKSPSEADDIVQEVLLKLYRSNRAFESDAHIKHWLIRVTVNECKKTFLSPWKRTEPLENYTDTLSFSSPEHSELFYSVMSLPKKYRVAIFLFYYEDYTCEEISNLLSIPNATVRTRLRRGREILKTNIQESDDYV